jgi:DNA-binding transcriptional ArsR family regulator
VTESQNIPKVAKALSDDLRVRIIRVLLEKPPLRYTDILSGIDLDNSTDSGKLAYHLNILTGADLVIKTEDSYRVTEMGCQVYASMTQTVADWEDLAFREELKNFSGWKVVSLLWSDSLNNAGIIFTTIGFILYFTNREPIYGVLAAIGIILLILNKYWKSQIPEEDIAKTIKHLKHLLGENRLIPELIVGIGVNCVTFLIILGLIYLTKMIQLDSFYTVIMLGCIPGVWVGIWLTQRMIEVWESFQDGVKPRNYSTTLHIITSIAIQSYLTGCILFTYRLVTDYNNQGPHIWLPINLLIASYNLFMNTVQK